MGASDRKAAGYPTAQVIKDWEFFMYCGGMGGAGPYYFMGTQRAVFKVKNNKFTVRNRLLILYNETFEVNRDAGPDGMGGRNPGPRLPLYWAAVANPALITNDEVIAKGDVINAALPYYVSLEEDDLPQPIDPAFNGYTYVIIVWDDPNAVSAAQGLLNDDGVQSANLNVVDYQQDVKI